MSRRLHEITADMLALEELLLESGGEFTPEVEALIAEMEGNLEAKATGYASLIREWEADAKKWKAEADRCAAHRKARENAAERLKERLRTELERMGRSEVEAGLFKIAVQGNPVQARVLVAPDALPGPMRRDIPEQVVAARCEANTDSILQALKAAMPEKPKKADDATLARLKELRDVVMVQRGDEVEVVPRVNLMAGDVILAEAVLTTHLRIR